MTYDGQVGIEAGELSHQFFTDLFLAAFAGENWIPLEGWNERKLIEYNPTICSYNLIETLPYFTTAKVHCHQTKEYLTKVQVIYLFFSYFLWKIVKKNFFETLKYVLKIAPTLTVRLFQFSCLIQELSLFLLGEFLAGRKFHLIKINHENK